MISKSLRDLTQDQMPDPQDLDSGTDVSMDMPDLGGMDNGTLNEDGSTTFNFGDDDQPSAPATFSSNLVDSLDPDVISEISDTLTGLFEEDIDSRADWENSYVKGLELLGIKMEERTKPWPGATGVYHPVLMEAAVRFQSQAVMELFPPQGPAKTRIIGTEDDPTVAMAQRVKDELNYILTKKMPDYRDETEILLFRVALAGSAFRKVYYDSIEQRPCAKFVPAEDLVVNYGESNLSACGRITYIDRITVNEYKRRKLSGFYSSDVSLGDPSPLTDDRITEKEDRLVGIRSPVLNSDRYEILEIHADYFIEGDSQNARTDSDDDDLDTASPYIFHIERTTGKVLAIYRNWNQQDQKRKKINYFVHYKYIPGMGFYGLGLIHLIGGLAKSSTSLLRQLIDAGTLSNLPGGLKSRGLRIKGDDSPIRPGEFRDVDVGSGDIQKNITFLPYKEPSNVLYQLLGNLVDEARRVGSIADTNVGDMNQEAPVGTTLALMERALKVMSAVQARCHAALAQELILIGDIVKDDMPPSYEYNVGGQFNRSQDFGSVDIIPVSDPGATTMAQRVVQYQAVVQLAMQNPQIYDMRKLHLDMLNVLGIKDAASLIPDPSNVQPADPVTENMSILKGSPAKAFQWQDHDSHLAVHMAMVNDPQIKQTMSQSPSANAVTQAMAAHIADHLAFQYRARIEEALGTQLPPLGQELPPDVQNQVAALVAKAAPQALAKSADENAQQQKLQQMQDPMVQLQQRELDIKEMQVQGNLKLGEQRNALDAVKALDQSTIEAHRIASQNGNAIIDKMQKGATLKSTEKRDILGKGLDTATRLATTKMQTDAQLESAKMARNNPNNQSGNQ